MDGADSSDSGGADFADAGFAGGDYMSMGYWSPDGRDSRLPLFGQGRAGERAAPNAWQVMVVDEIVEETGVLGDPGPGAAGGTFSQGLLNQGPSRPSGGGPRRGRRR
jgi:hypothetical protein